MARDRNHLTQLTIFKAARRIKGANVRLFIVAGLLARENVSGRTDHNGVARIAHHRTGFANIWVDGRRVETHVNVPCERAVYLDYR